MKKLYLLSVIFSFVLASCQTEFSQFNEKVIVLANNDKRIDQKEYESLIKIIEISEETGFKTFKTEDGNIVNKKVGSYLLNYLNAKKIAISESNIWQPDSESAKKTNFNINVFLENSGSMNGYMNDPSTSFKNSVYSLLTRLKLFAEKDSLNLYLVNQQDQLLYKNASNDDVERFKNILNPADFGRISGGKTGISDLNDLIKRCLNKVNDNNMSVFISDCIYSPGRTVKSASLYLADQKQGIFLNFATKLKEKDLSVIILQLFGKFQGTYYNRFEESIQIIDPIDRPFYIWIIGTPYQIESIIKSKKLEEIDGGYSNKLVLQKLKEVTQPAFKISYKPRIGDFNSIDLANGIITDASISDDPSTKGQFGFQLAVDFSNGLQDEKYYLDRANYELLDNKYSIIAEINPDKTGAALNGFTHILKLQTSELKDQTLRIDLIGKTPSWIYSSNSDDDSKIGIDISEGQKTFGFKYLVDGVCDAFYPKSNSNIINSISIIIKK